MSGHSELIGRLWRENRLFSALLELTYRCNLDCVFCYNDVGLAGRPLDRARWLALLDELAEGGVLHLTLSGGEPLAHPDFFAIGAGARERGFVVRVKSNGHALRGAIARRLAEEVDPYLVEVSLHGATAATHDRQTRVPGSFERLVENLRGLGELGLRFQINSTLTRWNEGEIEAMFELADRLGGRLQFDPEVTPKDDGDRSPLALSASLEGLRRLYEVEAARIGLGPGTGGTEGQGAQAPTARASADVPVVVRQGDALGTGAAPGKHCGAGSSNLCIDPFGNVYPCVQWRRPVGNLYDQSLAEIWARSTGLARVRALSGEIAAKLAGEEPALLNFCPGSAEMATGDSSAIYPAALARRELLRELRVARGMGASAGSSAEPAAQRVRLPVVG